MSLFCGRHERCKVPQIKAKRSKKMSLLNTPGALVYIDKSQLAARERPLGGTQGKPHRRLLIL